MTEVSQKQTPATPEEAADILSSAYLEVFGCEPSPEALAVMMAHTALETGHWRAMWNWNWGNIRGSYMGVSQSLEGADEIIDGKRVTGEAVERGFRAYPDAMAGAVDYVRFLGTDTTPHNDRPNRYQRAWDALVRGAPVMFAEELGRAGYYTADPDDYAEALSSVYRKYLPVAEELYNGMRDTLDYLDEAERAIARAKESLKNGQQG